MQSNLQHKVTKEREMRVVRVFKDNRSVKYEDGNMNAGIGESTGPRFGEGSYTGAHLYEQRRARTKIELTRGVNLHPCISQ